MPRIQYLLIRLKNQGLVFWGWVGKEGKLKNKNKNQTLCLCWIFFIGASCSSPHSSERLWAPGGNLYHQHSLAPCSLAFRCISQWKALVEAVRRQGWEIIPHLPWSIPGWQWLCSSKEATVWVEASLLQLQLFPPSGNCPFSPLTLGGDGFIIANSRY